MPLVLYHSPCVDGYTAAWACWIGHPDWEFRPAVHGEPPPTDIKGRLVFMLDFSFKREVILHMATLAKAIVILDHHRSAEKELTLEMPANVKSIFDMDKSGARLSWEYFNSSYATAPHIIAVVEDRDLWRFKLPDTRALNAVLFSHQYDFKEWDGLASAIQNRTKREGLIQEGEALERKQMKDVKELIRYTRQDMCIAGHTVPACNLPYTLASDACHVLLEEEPDAPFAACWFEGPTGRTFSLRSREGGVDVSEIAKQHGGGGHKASAGFRLPFAAVPA